MLRVRLPTPERVRSSDNVEGLQQVQVPKNFPSITLELVGADGKIPTIRRQIPDAGLYSLVNPGFPSSTEESRYE